MCLLGLQSKILYSKFSKQNSCLGMFFRWQNALSEWLGDQFLSNQPTTCVKSFLLMENKKLSITLYLWLFSVKQFFVSSPKSHLNIWLLLSLFYSGSVTKTRQKKAVLCELPLACHQPVGQQVFTKQSWWTVITKVALAESHDAKALNQIARSPLTSNGKTAALLWVICASCRTHGVREEKTFPLSS